MAVATQQQERVEVGARRVVFLLDACSGIERRILQQWVLEHHVPTGIPYEMIAIPPTRRRPRRPRLDSRLEACLAAYDDPLLTPLRVVWLPRERAGGPRRRLLRLLLLGDPRDPGRVRQALGARRSTRYQVVAGEAALASDRRCRPRGDHGSRRLRDAPGRARARARRAPRARPALQGAALRPRGH